MGDVAASPPPPDAALAAAASSGDMAAVTDADASCSKPGELRLLALAPPALTSDVADSALRNRRGGASGSSPLLPPPSLPLLRSGLSSKRALAHSGFRSERPLIPCTTLLKRRWESDLRVGHAASRAHARVRSTSTCLCGQGAGNIRAISISATCMHA
eukprot:365279-Chlamydomonas_euryale.AAC.14